MVLSFVPREPDEMANLLQFQLPQPPPLLPTNHGQPPETTDASSTTHSQQDCSSTSHTHGSLLTPFSSPTSTKRTFLPIGSSTTTSSSCHMQLYHDLDDDSTLPRLPSPPGRMPPTVSDASAVTLADIAHQDYHYLDTTCVLELDEEDDDDDEEDDSSSDDDEDDDDYDEDEDDAIVKQYGGGSWDVRVAAAAAIVDAFELEAGEVSTLGVSNSSSPAINMIRPPTIDINNITEEKESAHNLRPKQRRTPKVVEISTEQSCIASRLRKRKIVDKEEEDEVASDACGNTHTPSDKSKKRLNKNGLPRKVRKRKDGSVGSQPSVKRHFNCPCCNQLYSMASRRAIRTHVIRCACKQNAGWKNLGYYELVKELEKKVGREALRGFAFRKQARKRAADELPFYKRWYCGNEHRGCTVFFANSSTNSKNRHIAKCKYRYRPIMYDEDEMITRKTHQEADVKKKLREVEAAARKKHQEAEVEARKKQQEAEARYKKREEAAEARKKQIKPTPVAVAPPKSVAPPMVKKSCRPMPLKKRPAPVQPKVIPEARTSSEKTVTPVVSSSACSTSSSSSRVRGVLDIAVKIESLEDKSRAAGVTPSTKSQMRLQRASHQALPPRQPITPLAPILQHIPQQQPVQHPTVFSSMVQPMQLSSAVTIPMLPPSAIPIPSIQPARVMTMTMGLPPAVHHPTIPFGTILPQHGTANAYEHPLAFPNQFARPQQPAPVQAMTIPEPAMIMDGRGPVGGYMPPQHAVLPFIPHEIPSVTHPVPADLSMLHRLQRENLLLKQKAEEAQYRADCTMRIAREAEEARIFGEKQREILGLQYELSQTQLQTMLSLIQSLSPEEKAQFSTHLPRGYSMQLQQYQQQQRSQYA